MPRVTAGKLKNRKLTCPEGLDVRPSLEKTRAMIFNVLLARFELDDFIAVDLFAGSGALGIEAYSQGAKEVIFIEKNRGTLKNLEQNIQSLGIQKDTRLLHQDALTWLKTTELMDQPYLFLLDPPYGVDLAAQAMALIDQLAPKEAIIVVERGKTELLPSFEKFTLIKSKKLGRSLIDFYSLNL